jgi:hypothetical protein
VVVVLVYSFMMNIVMLIVIITKGHVITKAYAHEKE